MINKIGFIFALIYSSLLMAERFTFDVPFNVSHPAMTNGVSTTATKIYRVHGQRFKPAGQVQQVGRPLIIAHGIFNSYGVTIKLAQYLQQQGYDVWVYNHPGFGQAGLVTKEVGSSVHHLEGDYGLMSLVEGVGHMIEYVTKKTQQAPIFAGYSLGGMALDLYLHGVTQVTEAGTLVVDSQLAMSRQKSLYRAVYLGAPVFSFREMTRGLKMIFGASYCYSCLAPKKAKKMLNLGLGQEGTRLVNAANWLSRWLPESIWGLVLKDVTHYENMDAQSRQKLGQYLVDHFSNIHSDLVHDLARLSPRIEQGHLNSGLPYVNAVYIVGDRDGLANHQIIKKYVSDKQKINPRHELLTIEQVGHLDLMEQAIIKNSYGPLLVKWLKSSVKKRQSCEFHLGANPI